MSNEKNHLLKDEFLIDILMILNESTINESYKSENYYERLNNLIDVLTNLTGQK